ncbi:DegT/DnrJ/EryC1/StrS family aminotransferase [bacterium]|nr:MAG: DegT/DnrJ/EryC1/StrS family aminotransferase [bacterium]
MNRIPISKPIIGDEEKSAVMAVLDSGMLVQGERVRALEARIAELIGVRHAVAVSSGTAALQLALQAHDIGPGDEVITSPFSFVATANSIISVGATPVFADVDPGTFNLDPSQLEDLIGPRTKAIMPVHLYGQPCDMDRLTDIATAHRLAIIEDSAQAIGARFNGRPVGSFGTGTFSLYATKNLMSAEGGIVTTDDDTVADRVRLLRNHGMRERYSYVSLGYNFRMTDLQAAIAVAQFDRLEEFTLTRQANAKRLSGGITALQVPKVSQNRDHVWHQYTIRVGPRDREAAVRRLNEAGVGTGIFYPHPLTDIPHVRAATKGPIRVPVAEGLAKEVISLPVHPALTEEDLLQIVDAVNSL